jgi:hypothetical protein
MAAVPAAVAGMRTVVSLGVTTSASPVSSKPTTLTSPGTPIPRSASRLTTPAAISSL